MSLDVAHAKIVGEYDDDIRRLGLREAWIYRTHPFLVPADQAKWLRELLERPDVRSTLHLN